MSSPLFYFLVLVLLLKFLFHHLPPRPPSPESVDGWELEGGKTSPFLGARNSLFWRKNIPKVSKECHTEGCEPSFWGEVGNPNLVTTKLQMLTPASPPRQLAMVWGPLEEGYSNGLGYGVSISASQPIGSNNFPASEPTHAARGRTTSVFSVLGNPATPTVLNIPRPCHNSVSHMVSEASMYISPSPRVRGRRAAVCCYTTSYLGMS